MSFLDPRDPQNATFDTFLGVKLDIAFFMVSGGPWGDPGDEKKQVFLLCFTGRREGGPKELPRRSPEIKKRTFFHL